MMRQAYLAIRGHNACDPLPQNKARHIPQGEKNFIQTKICFPWLLHIRLNGKRPGHFPGLSFSHSSDQPRVGDLLDLLIGRLFVP